MFNEKVLTDYSRLVLKVGVNLQKNQGLEILCPVDCKEVARVMTKVAYQLGAKIVRIRWNDDIVQKLNYEYASEEALADIPKWFVDSKEDLIKRDFCYVAIDADDPTVFKDIPSEKLSAVAKAKSKALRRFSDQVMADRIRWCVVSVPSKAWAEQIFPNDVDAEKKLGDAIISSMRLDAIDPVKEWEEHISTLNRRAKFLNDKNFEYIHFENSLGTNLKVGLAENHVWLSAREKSADGNYFVANMPTEEIFTAPHFKKVDGVVRSALPLINDGQLIDGIEFTFKNGKIVGYTAEKGYQKLKGLIETDEGTRRLGEVALIGKNSPIAKSKTLFYNTLFDENASCHLALGKGYPTTVKDGENLSKTQLKKLGVNDSIEHVDFMIGTSDMKVTGVQKDGAKTVLFQDGDWVI